nr:hypothetical protein [Tanacetum cinerariifolium]
EGGTPQHVGERHGAARIGDTVYAHGFGKAIGKGLALLVARAARHSAGARQLLLVEEHAAQRHAFIREWVVGRDNGGREAGRYRKRVGGGPEYSERRVALAAPGYSAADLGGRRAGAVVGRGCARGARRGRSGLAPAAASQSGHRACRARCGPHCASWAPGSG